MDQLYLIKMALEDNWDSVQAYRNDLAAKLLKHEYEDPAVVCDHLKQLGKFATDFISRFESVRRDCAEGIVLLTNEIKRNDSDRHSK